MCRHKERGELEIKYRPQDKAPTSVSNFPSSGAALPTAG
jgi:hypothetical protein